MSAASCAWIALLSLMTVTNFAAADSNNFRFVIQNPKASWAAGSKQKVMLEGASLKGALGVRYRWMDEKSTLLLAGQIRRDGKNDWNDEILVPLYSVKGSPRLIIDVARGRSKFVSFNSGKEFALPQIKGLVIDNKPPVVANRQFNHDKTGHWVEIDVQDASGISQALLVVGADKEAQTVEGACKTVSSKTTCLYFIPNDPKGVSLTAQITDLAGNRTVASIQKGTR